MLHFYSLKVDKVKKETDDCVSISFIIPESLKEIFNFTQGQNITIKKEFDGVNVRRNYSICTSPLDNELKVAVKKTQGGIFSTYANEVLQAGDLLDVLPPTGNFYTHLQAGQQKNYVAFAAGSGITPILSIIKTTLQVEPKSNFVLVYGNRTKNSIIFKEELEALKDNYIDRFSLHYIFSREVTDAAINSGRLDREKCALFFSSLIDVKRTDDFFICGPESMIFCIKDLLEEKGVDKRHIHFELFTVPGEKTFAKHEEQTPGPVKEKAQVRVKLDGLSFQFELARDEESILDAALATGADLPYACKGGVCTTCKAKLIEGEVEMERNWGLDEEELAKGFILTCQSHPVTSHVSVDFDAR